MCHAEPNVSQARIILGSAEQLSVAAVAQRAPDRPASVWRWQQRFTEAGVDGLLRDATRSPAKRPWRSTVQRSYAHLCRTAREATR